MLTIFTIPKPFQGHINVIQRNAIKSWTALNPKCEIILFGQDAGVAETASELKIKHIPDIECNKVGTPLLNDVFEKAQKLAKYQKIVYVNCDIILLSDFIETIKKIQKLRFLLVGKRIDIEIDKELQFNDIEWQNKLRNELKKKGKLHGPTGIDYFVFLRGFWQKIPPFAIGRTAWDNWLIYKARSLRVPVINATEVITAVHQNHKYSHPRGGEGIWKGGEAKENLRLAGGHSYIFTIEDANWIYTKNGLKRPKITLKYVLTRLNNFFVINPKFAFLSKIIYVFIFPYKIMKRLGRRIKVVNIKDNQQ